jgi:ABC-type protease/lipase transport system fused ATPase/permease subunit
MKDLFMSVDVSKTKISIGMVHWFLQIVTLITLAVLGTFLYFNQQRVHHLEQDSARLVEQKLQIAANAEANSTKLIESLAYVSAVLERTNRAYEASLAKIASMGEKPQAAENVTAGVLLRK